MKTASTNLHELGLIPAFLLLTLMSIAACKRESSQDIVITGDLLSSHSIVEGKMLYLGNSTTRGFMDSVAVKNGKFKFVIRADKNFIPVKSSTFTQRAIQSGPISY
jgi:hypothetical protein